MPARRPRLGSDAFPAGRPAARAPLAALALEVRAVPATYFTTTTLASSLNPAAQGKAVTFTSTTLVDGGFGKSAPPPAGAKVEFYIDGKSTGTAVTDFDGKAIYEATGLAAGDTPVRVEFATNTFWYSPFASDTFLGSGGDLTQTVTAPVSASRSTTTTLVSSANPSAAGATVTFTSTTTTLSADKSAVMSAGGTAEFFVAGKSVGTVPADAAGVARFSTSTLTAGTAAVSVTFTGPTGYQSSTASLTQTITGASQPTTTNPPADTPTVPPPPPAAYNRPRLFASGTDRGVPGAATLHNPDGTPRFTVRPLGDGFTGGIRVATGDVTGDGVPDLIAGAGPGGAPRVTVYNGANGAVAGSFLAFEEGFAGGLYVAAADLDRDGTAELIVSPDEGGGPRVRVLRGADGAKTVADFYGIEDAGFRGGVRVDAGDVTGDQVPDLLVGAGFGGGPRVALYDGAALTGGGGPQRVVPDFYAFEPSLRNGAYVSAGDITGDGFADLVFGGGPGGGPRVYGLDGGRLSRSGGADQGVVLDRFVDDPNFRGGVRVSVGDVNGDGWGDLLVGGGAGAADGAETLIGPYFGDPLGFDTADFLGGGCFVSGEPLPAGALLPYLPDDPFYLPDPDAAADLAWLLYDENSWLGGLTDDYRDALFADPELDGLFGNGSFELPEYQGLTTYSVPQTASPAAIRLDRQPAPTISNGGSSPFPYYPSPTSTAANPSVNRLSPGTQPQTRTQSNTPRAIPNGQQQPGSQAKGFDPKGTVWVSPPFDIYTEKNSNIGADPKTVKLILGFTVERTDKDPGFDRLRMTGKVTATGLPLDGSSQGGQLILSMIPSESTYAPDGSVFIKAKSGNKEISFSGQVTNGVLAVNKDSITVNNGIRSVDPYGKSVGKVYLKYSWRTGDGLVR